MSPIPRVTQITVAGIWLKVGGEELFMPYNDFPWFKKQSIDAIGDIKEMSPGHYYWPKIDVDLTYEIIKNPHKFPLTQKI